MKLVGLRGRGPPYNIRKGDPMSCRLFSFASESFSLRSKMFPLVGALCVAVCGLASVTVAQTSIVVPTSLATSEGGTFLSSPFNLVPFVAYTSLYHQQVYAAGQFAAIGLPVRLESISFREDFGHFEPFGSLTYSDITVRLSTTSRSPTGLSRVYAENVGNDAVIVRSGDVTLSSTGAATMNGTRVFDITIRFTT